MVEAGLVTAEQLAAEEEPSGMELVERADQTLQGVEGSIARLTEVRDVLLDQLGEQKSDA